MTLPTFKYHPNPVESESIEESDTRCECCEKETGYIYTGPVYAEDELDECLCPWCIVSGKAHEKFDAEFTDIDGIGGGGLWEDVNDKIKEEIVNLNLKIDDNRFEQELIYYLKIFLQQKKFRIK